MKKYIPLLSIIIFFGYSDLSAQINDSTKYAGYAPYDTSILIWEIGAGIGLPYGVFGGKLSLGNDLITGDVGFGLVPFTWEPVFTFSSVIHFMDRWSTVRPKITLSYSNVAATTFILESSDFDVLYEETFPGFGVYAGIDWRLSKTGPFLIDINIGWIFPNIGNDKIKQRYNQAVDNFNSRGFDIDDEIIALDTPKISIGLSYAPARMLK